MRVCGTLLSTWPENGQGRGQIIAGRTRRAPAYSGSLVASAASTSSSWSVLPVMRVYMELMSLNVDSKCVVESYEDEMKMLSAEPSASGSYMSSTVMNVSNLSGPTRSRPSLSSASASSPSSCVLTMAMNLPSAATLCCDETARIYPC